MNRGRLDIIGSILFICKNWAKKTEIVYKANLNFKNAEVYIKWLNDREMIIKEGRFFNITSKGSEMLSNLQSASSVVDLVYSE
jgi:predicted transcriptional regulator